MLIEDLEGLPPELAPLQSAAAAFVQHAFDGARGRFRNLTTFDRRWADGDGSEDCHGRALWALGAAVGRIRRENFRDWAAALFEHALPALEGFISPRAIAFAVIGLHEHLRFMHGDLLANRLRIDLSQRLLDQFERNSVPGWPWLEDCVTYDNARIPQALILTGRWAARPEMLKTGLDALASAKPDGGGRQLPSCGLQRFLETRWRTREVRSAACRGRGFGGRVHRGAGGDA